MSTNGNFIVGLGDFQPPPYRFERIVSTTLTVPAKTTKLRSLCDRFLNRPLGRTGARRFVPCNDQLRLTFSRFPESESVKAPELGFVTYTEVCLTFSVLDGTRQGGMFTPALFLDGPDKDAAEYFATPPVVVGRELFGLPKMRGEITFNADLTGDLKCLFPSQRNTAMKLGDCIKVRLKRMNALGQLTQELDGISNELAGGPAPDRTAELVRQRDALEGRRAVLNAEIARNPARVFGRPHHPLEVLGKVWGRKALTLVPNQGQRAKIEAGLQFVETAEYDPARWATEPTLTRAVTAGQQSGLLKKLSLEDGFGAPLLGVRQLHDPTSFKTSAHLDVIRAPFQYDAWPMQTTNDYVVEILSKEIRQALGLDAEYEVLGADNFALPNVTAVYGVPGDTEVITR